ncbi:MarR family winged helix-turn-helix transcriptional regulator [Arenibaculum pallidiluteum]|uniref:MarR family winged helix-turn-helix transcriptional regulator n=1 Tax=Arenibaculum pallidiluteum TaxID=2812559 RepID=UPI001A976441|nr:MarR family transcriptional regulator [Arenibaculum pallidiluteum]
MTDQLAYLIASVNRRLEEELEEKLRGEGVPIEQMRILTALSDGGGLPMGDLAGIVLVEGPTLTKIVDRMVTNGLVYRSPDEKDRRRILIYLTNRGKALHDRLHGIVAEQQTRLRERLEGAQYEQLKALLQNLGNA